MLHLPIQLTDLDIAGTAVFAISGALVAARARQNLVTFCFFAAITGVGGGTVRDLLIGAPVFWMHNSTSVAVCLIMALLVWFTPHKFWSDRTIDWFDGIGLAAYAVYGAAKAEAHGIPWLPAAIMGVVTACMGGIFRDVLAGVPSIIIRPELYVTAAALAAGTFVTLIACGVSATPAIAAGFILGAALRGLAIWKGLTLPGYGR
ncbi:trimeric intracellular cation channel family protein [Acetobacter musti]|uniref:Trimeric intracellular cation channel family protein n=1 Tax=Acetobacter musti TaxID=864732 RepID=A0ABX0JQ84_9PROT|nr:trimeric intracellular cation channel family protein [Acetobacter musti]NHN85621.1 trimeric intracellular cation channel family protein [Acetobacter musti]